MRHPSMRAKKLAGFLVAFAAVVTASTAASGQDYYYYDRYHPYHSYVDRDLAVPFGHADMLFGFAFADYDWMPNYTGNGFAFAADVKIGVAPHLEVGAGFGARFNLGAQDTGAERYVRFNDEWLPGDVTNPNRATGVDTFSNPYFHILYAFLDQGPVMIGIEGFHNLPIAGPTYATCWTPGFGLPVHFLLGHRVRIETGFYHEFVLGGGCNGVDTMMYVPFRVNFAVTRRFWLGFRTGLEANNYTFVGNSYAIPLGTEGGVELIRHLHLVWDLGFPWFIHQDNTLGRNVWFDAFGMSVGLLVRI